jgi:phosphoribosylformylglycinamidine synthase
LFSESAARAIAVVRPGGHADFAAMCAQHDVAAAVIGQTGGQALEVTGQFSVPLDELSAAYRRVLPALFG